MAQERKKRRIVLTSVLKPVDDTRMFEKMGISLAQSGEYEVFIIAYPSSSDTSQQGIQFLPLEPFKRLSFKRLMAKWAVFRKLIMLKPAIVIFNTHELILPCILIKLFMEVKIVYDVRENYYRNILLSESFPWIVRWPLAMVVRFKEKLLAPAIDHFFLAEKGYENEFRFYRGGWTVIENKAAAMSAVDRLKVPNKIRLLFSGTLAASTGVFEAIEMAKALHKLDASVELTVIGYAALPSVREKIETYVKTNSWIRYTGGHVLVPHSEIEKAIQNADAGIISYPHSDHTINSHPTKLFEYLHARLPILLEKQWPWIARFESCKPFITYDAAKPDYAGILTSLKKESFYTESPSDVTWSSEEPRLLKALESLKKA